jgi:hypothetical protein
MSLKTYFPFLSWVLHTLTGRWARRIYVAVILILLCLNAVARLRSYFMTRKIQAVLYGLSEIRVDQTTEEQLLRTVPYLKRPKEDWKAGGILQRQYYAEISNDSDRLMSPAVLYGRWSGRLGYLFGYRYIDFGAGVFVQDGKVTSVGYGLSRESVRPKAVGDIVSAKSVHGFWLPYRLGFEVTSQDDESPKYRVEQKNFPTFGFGNEMRLDVTFTNDAPSELTKRAFQLNLSCFWGLRGCDDAREIAPGLWQDARTIKATALRRLEAGKCPDSVIEGRMRYLPDVSVLLLEVTGSRRIAVNEKRHTTEDWFTDYELKEAIRGRSSRSWKNVRFQRAVPSPVDPMRTIVNQNWPQQRIGGQVLFFGNLAFDSCRFIAATPSALEIVRKTPVPPKRLEDQIQKGLL